MCGIWAIFGSKYDVFKQVPSCMKIRHRGPDCFRFENINLFKNCAFGFHRLAVVENLQGMQPFRINAHPHLILVYNGEIYNYKLLAKQMGFQYETALDGECILHLYMKGGAEFAAAHLDGVFAFTILDCEKRLVFVARDSYSVRPAFRLLTSDGFLAISSEAKGLIDLHHDDENAKITPVYPGSISTYSLDENGSASQIDVRMFHRIGEKPKYITRITTMSSEIKDNIQSLLMEAVRKRMMGLRRVGCLLSGGLDSSLITSLVCKFAKEQNLGYKIQTFSTGLVVSPDIKAARRVANHLGTDHHEVIFTPEEGFEAIRDVIYHLESYDVVNVRAGIGMYIVSRYISTKTDNIILFSGEGADEVAQGYLAFHLAPSAAEADKESRKLLQDLYLTDNLRADRTTAGNGLEMRVPFLDHQFTSYYLSLPPEMRIPRNGAEKYLIRSAFDGSGLIPDEILWRPKEGFSDSVASKAKSWFLYLQEFIDGQITDEEYAEAGTLYPANTPTTKEMYYYRKIFESYFPKQPQLTPHQWKPKWTPGANPSGQAMTHYRDSDIDTRKEQ